MVVGVAAFSGSLRDLKLVPAKWRYLIPSTSPHHPYQGAPQGCYATGTPQKACGAGRRPLGNRSRKKIEVESQSQVKAGGVFFDIVFLRQINRSVL
jgi:hypothetical protein